VLNDKRIKSCLPRFDNGVYSGHAVSVCSQPFCRRSYGVPTAEGRQQKQQQQQRGRRREQAWRLCQQRQLKWRRNRQRQPRQQPGTNVAKYASWRHVLASQWCRADIEHVDSIEDDALMTKKTFRNLFMSPSHNQSLFYSAPKRCP